MNPTPSILLLPPLDYDIIATEAKQYFIVVHANSAYFMISQMKYDTIIGHPL